MFPPVHLHRLEGTAKGFRRVGEQVQSSSVCVGPAGGEGCQILMRFCGICTGLEKRDTIWVPKHSCEDPRAPTELELFSQISTVCLHDGLGFSGTLWQDPLGSPFREEGCQSYPELFVLRTANRIQDSDGILRDTRLALGFPARLPKKDCRWSCSLGVHTWLGSCSSVTGQGVYMLRKHSRVLRTNGSLRCERVGFRLPIVLNINMSAGPR